jgi:hypothetical protein
MSLFTAAPTALAQPCGEVPCPPVGAVFCCPGSYHTRSNPGSSSLQSYTPDRQFPARGVIRFYTGPIDFINDVSGDVIQLEQLTSILN